MEIESLKLHNQLCFPLYACSKEIIKRYKPFLDEINLTYTQYITMLVLWEERSISLKEIGEKIYLDSGTLTPVLKKLEDLKLIERKRSLEDERNLLITITKEGEDLKDKAKSIPNNMQKCFDLSEEEAETLYKTLYKILEKRN